MEQHQTTNIEISSGVSIQTERQRIVGYPIHSYKPIYRGQAAYILLSLNEKAIKCTFSSGKVRIFASTKIEDFLETIKESLDQYKPPKPITKVVEAFYHRKILSCICTKHNDCIYTYESNVPTIVANQFVGNIPTTKHMLVYNSMQDFHKDAYRLYKEAQV